MKAKMGKLPWSYMSKLSARDNNNGFSIVDAHGYVIAEVCPFIANKNQSKKIAKLIIESVNGTAINKISGLK